MYNAYEIHSYYSCSSYKINVSVIIFEMAFWVSAFSIFAIELVVRPDLSQKLHARFIKTRQHYILYYIHTPNQTWAFMNIYSVMLSFACPYMWSNKSDKSINQTYAIFFLDSKKKNIRFFPGREANDDSNENNNKHWNEQKQ